MEDHTINKLAHESIEHVQFGVSDNKLDPEVEHSAIDVTKTTLETQARQ